MDAAGQAQACPTLPPAPESATPGIFPAAHLFPHTLEYDTTHHHFLFCLPHSTLLGRHFVVTANREKLSLVYDESLPSNFGVTDSGA